MHVIMEEEEMYEESILGTPEHLSESEVCPSNDMSVSHNESMDTPMRSVDMKSTTIGSGHQGFSPQDAGLSSPPMHSNKYFGQSYNEPEQKEGHVLFSILRSEVLKAFNLKSPSKADSFLDRVTFIARKLVNIWFGKDITIEQFNMFVDLLKEKAYLISFPILLESFRKLGYFEIDRNGFQPFCELILACLTEVKLLLQVCGAQKCGYPFVPFEYSIDLLH